MIIIAHSLHVMNLKRHSPKTYTHTKQIKNTSSLSELSQKFKGYTEVLAKIRYPLLFSSTSNSKKLSMSYPKRVLSPIHMCVFLASCLFMHHSEAHDPLRAPTPTPVIFLSPCAASWNIFFPVGSLLSFHDSASPIFVFYPQRAGG